MILGEAEHLGLKFELTEDEINRLRKLHNAIAVKEMTEHPGWAILLAVSTNIIERMENEHLSSALKMDRDRYWMQGAELNGARKYARMLTEVMAHQIASLDQNYVAPNRNIDIADLDGDLNGEND